MRNLSLCALVALAVAACSGGGGSGDGSAAAASPSPAPAFPAPAPAPTPKSTPITADTSAPTTPNGLTATAAGATEIGLSWNASSDNVGVTGYQIRRDGAVIGTTTATGYAVGDLATNTTFSYTVSAQDAAGNTSANSASASATTGSPPATADFTTRCAQPGVLRCVGFDSAADIAGTFGNNSGILDSGASTPVLDASIKASGASSLRFTIPSNSSADTSGSFFTNFSTDLSTQFSENAEFYIQWRQRFSPEFLDTVFAGGGGWKQVIVSAGDKPGCTASNSAMCQSSCTALETVVQNTFQRGFAQMYNSCTGSTSHGGFDPFEEAFGGDFKLQNARPSPFCLYSQANTNPKTSFPPAGNCIGYVPNEWMTFQVRIQTGPRVNDEWTNSSVTLWIARDGQPSKLAIAWGPYNLAAGSASDDLKFGKIWLLPYDTGKDPLQAHPTGFTWYDELIISRTKIADPSATPTPTAPPPLVNTELGNLARSMKPGTWAQLNPTNQDAVLGVGNVSGTMINFCNSMPWNPFSKVIEIVGMDHNWGMQRHVRYDEASNSFVVVVADDGLGSQVQHGFDHNGVNPFTGDLYHRFFRLNTGFIRSFKKALGSSTFAELPMVAAASGAEQVAIGATWWSGAFAGGGAQGSWMIFNSGNAVNSGTDGQIVAFNPLTDTWFFNKDAMAPFYGSGETYHSLMEYSASKNVAVYGGGNAAPNRLWRLNSDGSFIAMQDVPPGKSVGIQRGLLVNDPVSGNFLLLSAGQLWELNPDGSGTWTQQIGSRVPPGAVGVPDNLDAVIASSIPDYGVVAFITQPGHANGSFFLYKHQ